MKTARTVHTAILVLLTVAASIGAGLFIGKFIERDVHIAEENYRSPFFKSPFFELPIFEGDVPMLLKESATPPLAVMIENHTQSRPYHSGLSQAEIVYEAPTESRITRFMAIFPAGSFPAKIGPVRSSRIYFIDWALEYNPLYVHVGGHWDALARLTREAIVDVDQSFYGTPYFRRENVGKVALEHTMFTTGELMQQLIGEKLWGWNIPAQLPLLGKKNTIKFPGAFPNIETIRINFGEPSYRVIYQYDKESERYKRFHNTAPHMDTLTNEQIAPRAVIIQRVIVKQRPNDQGTILIENIGAGDAIIFFKGKAVMGTWEKKSAKEPTHFFDKNGEEILFSDTPVWVEVLPINDSGSYETGPLAIN